jgi:hypothetical protein
MEDASSNADPQPAQTDAPCAALDEEEAALGQRVSELFPRRVACGAASKMAPQLETAQGTQRWQFFAHDDAYGVHTLRRNLVSLFSPPDYLKGRDGGGGARPLAVAGSSGAGGLDLERMQARQASHSQAQQIIRHHRHFRPSPLSNVSL